MISVSDKLSISEHIQHVVSRCAQSLHALRILRSCGMEDNILQLVFTSVILGRMTYAISAWWGYATAADKQRLEAFIRRALRTSVYALYPADGSNLHQLVSDRDRDDALFAGKMANHHHVLRQLLPNTTTHKSQLWTVQ